METQTPAPTNKSTPPILVIAAIAVVIFSATGTAAIMGWLPTSYGNTNVDAAVAEQQSQDIQKGQESTVASTSKSAENTSATKATAPVKVAAAPVKTVCYDCGVVEAITEVKTRGEGSGLGAVGGAVVGGLVGNQFGGGDGKKVTTAAGVIGGALAGHQIEKEVKATRSYAVTVRLEDGSTRVFSVATAPSWQAGDKVKIVNGEIQAL